MASLQGSAPNTPSRSDAHRKSRAFCTGGDQSAHDGSYDGRGTIGLPMETLHGLIRLAPKPIVAKVRGYAIGGGNALATLCDLTIAAESAQFG
jgi:2-ketocyclohexanecarboxyl-CoA hydrolase